MTAFPQADCLAHLESLRAASMDDTSLPSWLVQALPHGDAVESRSKIIDCLVQLLTAKKGMWQAALDTGLIADELRRYQKFAKPGQPSAHIVQLRQKQAAARQASSIARQSFIKAAAAFVREAKIEVPQRLTLEAFSINSIDNSVPPAAPAV
jgi:DNA-binding phage protein